MCKMSMVKRRLMQNLIGIPVLQDFSLKIFRASTVWFVLDLFKQ